MDKFDKKVKECINSYDKCNVGYWRFESYKGLLECAKENDDNHTIDFLKVKCRELEFRTEKSGTFLNYASIMVAILSCIITFSLSIVDSDQEKMNLICDFSISIIVILGDVLLYSIVDMVRTVKSRKCVLVTVILQDIIKELETKVID